ncbi:TIGR03943 family putative permease subunit [Microbacterium stercoris]|uniref:TIGR03943 family protein n=1 Tax=Microbacterium stercoris TaxID=2820289 RepID=A0A939QH93_9MICO|nr:TIGR03943 family protein [Microbacterium stercoris]MBO3662778.1 TIGR03943 family protein [Microbacterium stercoris]
MRDVTGRRALGSIGTRWLGAGLAAALAVVTLGLALTDRLALYINPDQAWFAIAMAIVALAGAVASFVLPLGAEDDHGHDHGPAHAAGLAEPTPALVRAPAAGPTPALVRPSGPTPALVHPSEPTPALVERARNERVETPWITGVLPALGGLISTAVVAAALVLPPAPLSAQLAMSRDTGAPPLFAGADEVLLAGADTSSFGVGEWASVFATAANPDAYVGTEIDLTGFVAPGDDGALRLGRLVVTHCVIDAQPAALPVVSPGWDRALAQGDWIRVQGTIATDADGALVIEPAALTPVDAPGDPYEY